jgi:hypothetical protein
MHFQVTVLGTGWSVSVGVPSAPESDARPANSVAISTTRGTADADIGEQPLPEWLDSHRGRQLEDWIVAWEIHECSRLR